MDNFIDRMAMAIEEEMAGAEVRNTVVYKTNRKVEALIVKPEGSSVGINIYPDDYEKAGIDAKEAARQAVALCRANERTADSLKDATDLLKKENVIFQLINAERNRELLETHPHRGVCGGYAIIYRILIPERMEEGGLASIKVSNQIAEALGLSEAGLYELAKENTPRLLPVKIGSLMDFCLFGLGTGRDRLHGLDEVNWDGELPIFVMTNGLLHGGASTIFYPGVADALRKNLGECYILPSSIHELIVVPAHVGDPLALKETVSLVNGSEVSEDEYLGDTVLKITKDGIESAA